MAATTPQGKPSASLERLAADRMVIEAISPCVDGGRFAAKVVEGWATPVEADLFGDGHEVFGAAVEMPGGALVPMTPLGNDRWGASVVFPQNGPAQYAILAWRDLWGGWARDTGKKIAAGQDVSVELQEARQILEQTEAPQGDATLLAALIAAARAGDTATLLAAETAAFMAANGPRATITRSADIPVWVDRERAAFSAWYEMFPRSQGPKGQHGTFRDVIGRLDYVADLGFDILYFPPIHPIGTTNRKGRNNMLTAQPGDVGSPYAIGSAEGGMDAVHPELGTLDDFDALVAAARAKGIEIALDIALNASPDHPWIAAHPGWFERRPDGTIKFAENPPKKYEDIVNFKYYNADGSPNAPFWEAVRDLFLFWIGHGVTAFRVDNPHTKPFPFWEWIIAEVRQTCPDAIFLSEAFTRPKVMKRLAKLGFNQSYTYYTWRNTKADAIIYQLHVKAFFRTANGDGIGDFAGLIDEARLPEDLGVTAIWLLPFYPSPLRDDGYDIADYTNDQPPTARWRLQALRREAHAAAQGDHRAGDQPHLRPAPLVPAGAPREARHPGARLLRLERRPTRRPETGSSSPTPRRRTGPGIRWPKPTTGTASTHHQPDLNFDNPEV
jgi:starch synthase (maltosyl-transferring)